MPATCHICCDDEVISRRIQDTIHTADRDDDTDELDEQTLARLERRQADRIYFRTMRKSYAAKT